MVIAVDLDGEAVCETVDRIGAACGAAKAVVADVAEEADVGRYVTAARAHGPVAVPVNNAAIYHERRITEMTVEEFDREMRVNVRSHWLGLKAVLPEQIERRGGSVVNVASVNGLQATPGTTGYTTSQHATIGLTKAAAMEVAAYGVRVNAICPAMTDTPMFRGFLPAERVEDVVRGLVPLGRTAQAAEQARVVAFLASEAASYITGAAVLVDGGMLAARITDQEPYEASAV
jgi:NAD(P)-dependent dehydrogenase (short-subunit alcohol dehydrogenase family)